VIETLDSNHRLKSTHAWIMSQNLLPIVSCDWRDCDNERGRFSLGRWGKRGSGEGHQSNGGASSRFHNKTDQTMNELKYLHNLIKDSFIKGND